MTKHQFLRMKRLMVLFLSLYGLVGFSQDTNVYIESGLSVQLNIHTPQKALRALNAFATNDITTEHRVDNSYALGIAVERIRTNTGYRLQANVIVIDQFAERRSRQLQGAFGDFVNVLEVATKQIDYELILGLNRYVIKNKWLLGIGLEMPISFLGKRTEVDNNEFSSSSSNGAFSFSQSSIQNEMITYPNGFSVGLGVNIGLYYRIVRMVRLGFTYAPSLRYTYSKGLVKGEVINKNLFLQTENGEVTDRQESNTITSINTDTKNIKVITFYGRLGVSLAFDF